MTAHWHHRWRLVRRGLGYGVAIALVAMALAAAVVSQLLPLAERHPDRVAAWLSARLDRPVAFDRLQTQWTRRGPLLRLDGLRIGPGDRAIRIGDAQVLVSQYAGLLPGRSFTELRLHGLELTLERGADGRWQVRGLPGERQAGGDPFAPLEGLGELQVIDGKLTVLAPGLGIRARLPRVDVRLRVDGDRVRAGLRAWMRAGRSPVVASADFSRERGDGKAYLAARQADLSAWAPLLHVAGAAVEGGRGRVEAWAALRDHRIARVQLDADLVALALRGHPLADGRVPRRALDRLRLRAAWRALDRGWRVDLPTARLVADGRESRMDGAAIAGGAGWAAVAPHLDIGPLLGLAALGDGLDPGLRAWLVSAQPRGRVNGLRFSAGAAGRVRAEARLDGLGFAPVGDAPGFEGLAGALQGDEAGFVLDLDPQAPFRFDWPAGFGVPHPARLSGRVAGWREGAGWRIGTSGLRIDGGRFGADVRGSLWFQGDGTRPRIDLAARLDGARIPVAKGFWIHHLMAPATIQWLDAALVDGRVEDGRALVSGDLDDWPFTANDGRFEASAHIADATLRFQPDWPAAEHLDADVHFVADGFEVRGKAVLAGVGIRRFEAGIPHLGAAELSVSAQGGGDASRLLGLLHASPLQQDYGQTLDALQAQGLASVDFELALPLHGRGTTRLGGTVALAGVRLRESRWDVDVADMRGKARYDRGGFDADGLAVRYADRPATLSLRAGDHARAPGTAFEAELAADVSAGELLSHAPQLDWLRPYIKGRSRWNVAVSLPSAERGAQAPPARLRLRSDLVGTALSLPAPLDKPPPVALATTVDARLPLESGDVSVGFGRRLALRARSGARGTGVRVQLGSDHVDAAAPASGLVATGHAASLDALDWAMLASGGGASAGASGVANAGGANSGGANPGGAVAPATGSGLSLREVDVVADHLRMLGSDFPATRVRAAPEGNGTRLRFDGDALAGSVRVPAGEGGTVVADLQRLHWRNGAPTPGAAAGQADAASGGQRSDGGGMVDRTRGASASADGVPGEGRPGGSVADRGVSSAGVSNGRASNDGASNGSVPDGSMPDDSMPDDSVDPSKVPPLDVSVADFRFGDADLGALRLRTRPTAAGLQVQQLQTRAPRQRIDATGDWRGPPGATRTHLALGVESEDFGALLGGFGYGGQLARGQGQAALDAAWAGGPAAFRLDALDGTLRLDMKDGQLVEIEPGAGRVLGLLSIAQLPRRLTLDFRDFFNKGFAFDTIRGDVRLGGGRARTDDLVIEGPSARIQISGAADLRAQTFDQTILVLPKAGNLLTAVGAIAGGPVGAAIGAAANAVLKKPLGELAAKTYHVTGPWKDPKVDVSSRESPHQAAPGKAPRQAPQGAPAPAEGAPAG